MLVAIMSECGMHLEDEVLETIIDKANVCSNFTHFFPSDDLSLHPSNNLFF